MREDSFKILSQLQQLRDPDVEAPVDTPNPDEVLELLATIRALLVPDYTHHVDGKEKSQLISVYDQLKIQIQKALHQKDVDDLVESFVAQLPEIRKSLLTDLQAIYDGDPSAHSKAEIIMSYPGFYAIAVYRLAHALYELKIPYLPRIMSEHAHSQTGIDIHPGATIGDYFAIDHGNGIVIGETTIIGHHVRLYQGVTLGVKRFKVDENGKLVKGWKRHPNIGNDVVIYANATILGGETFVGDHSVIGGNVWLTHSVEKGSFITYHSNDKIKKKQS